MAGGGSAQELGGVEAGEPARGTDSLRTLLAIPKAGFCPKVCRKEGFLYSGVKAGLEWCEAHQRAIVIIQRKVKT